MRTSSRVELSLEDLEAVNGGNFWDDVKDFGEGLWSKTVNVVRKLKNWGIVGTLLSSL